MMTVTVRQAVGPKKARQNRQIRLRRYLPLSLMIVLVGCKNPSANVQTPVVSAPTSQRYSYQGLVDLIHKNDLSGLQKALSGGANPDVSDSRGYRPLMNATRIGNVDAMKLLIKHGAKLDATNSSGETALFSAVRYCHVGAVKVLVQAGSDVTHANLRGGTPVQIAQYCPQKTDREAILALVQKPLK